MSTAADALYQTVQSYPGGAKALAIRMGMSGQILSNKVNPNLTNNHPTLAEVDQIMGLTGDYRVLHALAESHGHIAVKVDMPEAMHSSAGILALICRVMSASGGVGESVREALADGSVDAAEIVQIRANVIRSQQALLEMLAQLEKMVSR